MNNNITASSKIQATALPSLRFRWQDYHAQFATPSTCTPTLLTQHDTLQ